MKTTFILLLAVGAFGCNDPYPGDTGAEDVGEVGEGEVGEGEEGASSQPVWGGGGGYGEDEGEEGRKSRGPGM